MHFVIATLRGEFIYYLLNPKLISVREENLSEVLAGYHLQQILGTMHVELVEKVVQKQDGRESVT